MAWVHRTTRENNRVGYKPHNTPSHVGPGSYTAKSAFKKRSGPSFAPFQSTSDRGGGVLAETTAHYTPGPGAYVVEGTGKRVQGHHAASTPFLSLQERFKPPPTKDTPGPGAYKASSTFKRKRGGRRKAGGAGAGADAPAVTWVRVPTAPSIPAANQSYGYEEGEYGELTMQKAPGKGHTGRGTDTAGPGSYNPNDRVLAGRRRVAVDFGRSRSRRTDFAKSEVPGPGEYTGSLVAGSSRVPRPGTWVRDRSKQSANFASRVGRGGAKPHKPLNVPGPGAYGARSSFKKQPVPERQQFFGSTTRRFKHRRSRSAGPGPGSYEVSRSTPRGSRLAPGGRQPPNTAHVGFASTSARFGFSKPSSEKPTPGAGSYNTTGLADALQRKPAARNGVFGSTSKRFYEPVSATAPGPGAYETAPKQSRRTRDLHSKQFSVFASKQGRFNKKQGTSIAPPPGTYEINPTWRTRSFARRRNGQGLLASGPKRFAAGGILSQDRLKAPGPGAYENTQATAAQARPVNRKNVMVSKAPRLKVVPGQPKDVTPGPGTYDMEYVYGSLHKRTFNMTIAEQEAGW